MRAFGVSVLVAIAILQFGLVASENGTSNGNDTATTPPPAPEVTSASPKEGSDTNKWNYGQDLCTGKPSPINIDTKKVEKKDFGKFTVTAKGTDHKLRNIGYTVAVVLNDVTVKGGGLVGDYKVESLRFHWGDVDTVGSEHQIDGKSFPMEIQMVMSSGSKQKQFLGIAVELATTGNPELKKITDKVSNTLTAGVASDVKFALDKLIPASHLSTYYRYTGSETIPDCNPAVWSFGKGKGIPITKAELNKFRTLMGNHSTEPMKKTFLKAKAMGATKVYLSGDSTGSGKSDSAATNVMISIWSLILPAMTAGLIGHMSHAA